MRQPSSVKRIFLHTTPSRRRAPLNVDTVRVVMPMIGWVPTWGSNMSSWRCWATSLRKWLVTIKANTTSDGCAAGTEGKRDLRCTERGWLQMLEQCRHGTLLYPSPGTTQAGSVTGWLIFWRNNGPTGHFVFGLLSPIPTCHLIVRNRGRECIIRMKSICRLSGNAGLIDVRGGIGRMLKIDRSIRRWIRQFTIMVFH